MSIQQYNNFSIDLNGEVAYYCIEEVDSPHTNTTFIIYPLFLVQHIDKINQSFNNTYLAAPVEKLDICITITENCTTQQDLAGVIKRNFSSNGVYTWYSKEGMTSKLVGNGVWEQVKPEYDKIYKRPDYKNKI